MRYRKATTAAEAVFECNPFALERAGDSRYVDLSDSFGLCPGGRNMLITDLESSVSRQSSFHAVLAGTGGSGKSTLIFQHFDKFKEVGLFPVYVDVIESLDTTDITYSDLMLTLVERIDLALCGQKVAIDENVRNEVIKWFSEELLTEEHVRELDLQIAASVKAGASVPFVGKFFAKILAAFKGGSKYREEIRQRIDRKPYELVDKVNMYLKAAKSALGKKDSSIRGILFFYDNLEKIRDTRQIDIALIKQATLHKKIECFTLFTIPFQLLITPGEDGGLVRNQFEVYLVPMVKLRYRGNYHEPRGEGVDASVKYFGKIIEERLEVNHIFDDSTLLDEIVLSSGGCPRDLLHITQTACRYAGVGKVSKDNLISAITRVRGIHLDPIREKDFEILARVHLKKQIRNIEEEHRLINHRLIVHYNDERWYDVHPLVWDDERFNDAITSINNK